MLFSLGNLSLHCYNGINLNSYGIILPFVLLSSEQLVLRHVETDVLIPKRMREKAKELCAENVVGMST